jgi:hypothetical protein
MITRESRPRGAAPETAAKQSAETIPKEADTTDDPPMCDAAGVLCGALDWLEREAAGRARLCCRHYLDGAVA